MFFFFCLHRKSLDWAGSIRQWEGWDESSFFVRAGSPQFLAAQICFYQMGLVPALGPSVVVQALQSLRRGGGLPAAGLFLDLFSADEQLCPEVCAYSARLAPCPPPSPQVFRASPAPPVPAVLLAQPRAVQCLVQSEAPQTWRVPELSPVVLLGQPSIVGVDVLPGISLSNGKARACSACALQSHLGKLHLCFVGYLGAIVGTAGNEKSFPLSLVPLLQTASATGRQSC